MHECIMDNFWYRYNNKREETGYMLSILKNLAECFHMMNELLPITDNPEVLEQKLLYVVFKGKLPWIYISFEEIVAPKIDAKLEVEYHRKNMLILKKHWLKPGKYWK